MNYLIKYIFSAFLFVANLFASNMISKTKVGDVTIEVVVGDIVKQSKSDAIVNAANDRLERGGGVCGAIFGAHDETKASRKLADECYKIAKKEGKRVNGRHLVQVSGAYATSGFGLNKYIIHAVSPNFDAFHSTQKSYMFDVAGKEKLRKTYANILDVSEKKSIKKISMPLLSGGIFRGNVPFDAICKQASKAVVAFCNSSPKKLGGITFVFIDPKQAKCFSEILRDEIKNGLVVK